MQTIFCSLLVVKAKQFLCDKATRVLSNDVFDLTQFSSNSQKVLASLPECRLSSKIKDSRTKVLPEESALGIVGNTESDKLCYRLELESKSTAFTKRSSCSFYLLFCV